MKNYILILFIIMSSCARKAFDERRFEFDPQLRTLFMNITKFDSMVFLNDSQDRRVILIKPIDSSMQNRIGGIMSMRPFKVIGTDLIDTFNNKHFKGEVYLNIYPDSLENTLKLKLGNVYCTFHKAPPYRDTTLISNNKSYNKVLKLDCSYFFWAVDNTKDTSAIRDLYLDEKNGIVKMISLDSQVWDRVFP